MGDNITRGGEIYFIGERDLLTGETSPYVKIGLVRDDRASSARQGDHQTGNPRELFLHDAVKVEMVQTVEKSLHWHFAPKRVTGEWFYLSAAELAEAVRKCRELGAEFELHVDALRVAEHFSDVLSADTPITASADTLHWWRRQQVAAFIVKACDGAVARYKAVLKADVLEGKDVGDAAVARTQLRKDFDEKGFRAAYPELWAAHLGAPTIKSHFTVTKLAEGELLAEPEVVEIVTVVERFDAAIADYSAGGRTLAELGRSYVEFLSLTEFQRTQELLAKGYLMSLCGDAPEITGVCKWKRTAQPGSLDRRALEAAEPEKYGEFVTTKQVDVVAPKRKAGAGAADGG